MLHDARAVFDVLFITRSLHAKNARIVALSAEEGNGGHTHTEVRLTYGAWGRAALSVRPCVSMTGTIYILCTRRIAAGCTHLIFYTDSGFHKTQNPKHDKGVCTTHIREAVRYTRVKYMFAIGTRLGLGSREHIRRHVLLCDQKLKLK